LDTKSHWDKVYRRKRQNEVGWYRPHLDLSLQLIEEATPDHDAHIIDIGGGESTLVDDLVTRGYRNLSVLDVSATALDVAKGRLGYRGTRSTGFAVTLRRLPSRGIGTTCGMTGQFFIS